MSEKIRIGTRDSQLAMWQTEWVQDQLQKIFPDKIFEIKSLKTTGDKILGLPLSKIGDKGLFTRELDRALLDNEIELAVHSLKDVPTVVPDGLIIGAITERWDPRDALISRSGNIFELPPDATVATGSLRRRAQLLHRFPGFNIMNLRGNLNTRFRKFDESGWNAMILAVAGVERLGWKDRITEKLSLEIMLPAVGQGSFTIMCREDDRQIKEMLQPLNHYESAIAARTERALLRTLEGGCQVPIGAFAGVKNNRIHFEACLASLDGRTLLRDRAEGPVEQPVELGVALAHRLLDAGGDVILDEIIKQTRQ